MTLGAVILALSVVIAILPTSLGLVVAYWIHIHGFSRRLSFDDDDREEFGRFDHDPPSQGPPGRASTEIQKRADNS